LLNDRRHAHSRFGRVAAALAVGLAVAAAGSSVATGATSSAGGVIAPGTPKVKDVRCLTRCVSGHSATPGATVKVKGTALDYVRTVVFRGKSGPLEVRTTYRDGERVKAVVPRDAVSGRPYVVDFRGTKSNPSPVELEVLPPSAIPEEIFPIRGPHDYGSAAARFGAPRSGHTHQGQDMMAACGTKLVSVRKARVRYRAYQGAAGNYVVLHNIGTNTDFVYMHLIRPASVSVGRVIGAGDTVGFVGATGDASGCHLHFEYWVGPWYGGGHPVDPLPFLKALDRKS
jgi:murein DD-endopeptidase MepM/ murein hydrolase activator NlpD